MACLRNQCSSDVATAAPSTSTLSVNGFQEDMPIFVGRWWLQPRACVTLLGARPGVRQRRQDQCTGIAVELGGMSSQILHNRFLGVPFLGHAKEWFAGADGKQMALDDSADEKHTLRLRSAQLGHALFQQIVALHQAGANGRGHEYAGGQ